MDVILARVRVRVYCAPPNAACIQFVLFFFFFYLFPAFAYLRAYKYVCRIVAYANWTTSTTEQYERLEKSHTVYTSCIHYYEVIHVAAYKRKRGGLCVHVHASLSYGSLNNITACPKFKVHIFTKDLWVNTTGVFVQMSAWVVLLSYEFWTTFYHNCCIRRHIHRVRAAVVKAGEAEEDGVPLFDYA